MIRASRRNFQELLDCLFVKFNDKNKVRDDISAQAFAGYQMFELIALGGTDEEGNDLTNEMSYMCLDALAHVGMPMPSVGSRIGNQTPDEFLYRNIEVIRWVTVCRTCSTMKLSSPRW